MRKWQSVKAFPPPEDVTVETKIDDGGGMRNQQLLFKRGSLWWFPDGSMYVYYTPTHWRERGDFF
jgi:hypothetical protein